MVRSGVLAFAAAAHLDHAQTGRLSVAATFMALLVGCTSASVAPPSPEANTIRGSFELTQYIRPPLRGDNEPCAGDLGYADISAGTQVTVRDEANELLATSSLGPGTSATEDRCTFTFAVTVPPAAFYSVEVGRRGGLSYSHDEMVAKSWRVSFTLGD